MERTITLTIPSEWLPDKTVDQEELRQALRLGLAQLRQQKTTSDIKELTIQALLSTGRIHRPSVGSETGNGDSAIRQPPPKLPGKPVSEILIEQRRGDS